MPIPFFPLAAGAIGNSAEETKDVGQMVHELAAEVTGPDRNLGLVAKRTLWRTIRHAGRPGAEQEKASVVAALITLLKTGGATDLQREIIWMLSEIGSDESVEPVAGQLANESLREDARMALERIPSTQAVILLKAALANAPLNFKSSLAQSLSNRGVAVDGFPCQKLVPTKKTTVGPID